VCYCFSVTERKIREVIRANNLRTVEDVTHYCKAGGGCGTCHEDIEDILKDNGGHHGHGRSGRRDAGGARRV